MGSMRRILLSAIVGLALAQASFGQEAAGSDQAAKESKIQKLKIQLREKEDAYAALQAQLKEEGKAKGKEVAGLKKAADAAQKEAQEAKAAREAAEAKLQEVQDSHAESESDAAECAKKQKVLEVQLDGSRQAQINAQDALRGCEDLMRSNERGKKEAEEEVEGLREELKDLQAANKNLLKAQKELSSAQAALDACSGGRDSALRTVESKLAAAQAQLQQAESREQDVAARLQEILDRHQKSWLPPWMEERYNKSYESLRPHAEAAWEHASNAHITTQTKLSELSQAAQGHVKTAWAGAGPAAKNLLAKAQAFLASLHKGHKKHLAPQLKKAWAATKGFAQKLAMHPQVLHARRRLDQGVADVKGHIGHYLKQHHLSAQFAKEPFLTGILYTVIALPLVAILPLANLLSGLLGGKKRRKERKPPRRVSAASSTSTSNVRGIVGKAAAPAKPSSSKGRRITVGEDSIRVPQ